MWLWSLCGLNLNTPFLVAVCVCVQVSSFPASLQLLSILQTLLALKPDRSAVWMALETITNRAILLAEDSESAQKQH